ncbi:MAG: S8 family serine peptidase, partial [Acidobacteriota bacterium]
MRLPSKHRLTFVSCVFFAVFSGSVFAGTLKPTSQSVTGEVLVNILAGSTTGDIEAMEHAADVDQSEHVANVRNGAIWRMHSRGKNTEALIAALQRNPKIAYAEPNYIVHSTATPNDPYYSQLYALRTILGAEQAWDVTTGSSSIVIGVVDTGINYMHPDLAGNVWSNPGGKGNPLCAAGTHGYNALANTCDPADDNYHGTHVSGTIGAVGNNNAGVVGVNWTTSIMALKFLDSYGYGSIAGAIAAIDFAVQAKIDGVNVRVLSNSWGGGAFSKALLDEINKAAENDILFVASAGNDHADTDLYPQYPSGYTASNVISVAATDSLDGLASFSNFGLKSVHLGAPGVSILSTYGNSYGTLSGTSMAAPQVAGAAALLLAQSPTLTTAQVKTAILSNTEAVPSLNGKTVTGGRLSLGRMFGAPPAPVFSIAITPSSLTVAAGESATFTVTLTPDAGFNEPVTLYTGGLPSGSTPVF